MTTHYEITVAEFLEFEFCFEVAEYLGVEPIKHLVAYKTSAASRKDQGSSTLRTDTCLYAVVPNAHAGSE